MRNFRSSSRKYLRTMTLNLKSIRRFEMKLPQFNAEASLGSTMGRYVGGGLLTFLPGGLIARLGAIEPQQALGVGTIFGGDCFGSVDQCLDRFCVNLPPGKQRAECFAACQQPSVCGDCRCTCTPDCVRTCLRTCTKSTPSAILTCSASCIPLPGVPFPDDGFGTVSTNP